MSIETQKKAAAAEAIKFVESEMVLGLGTGSTAKYFVDLLGEKVRAGLRFSAIATSRATHNQALSVGIEMIEPDETTQIDLAVDGADEIDPSLQLIKGGGGALLREKIVADAAQKFIVIADHTKNVSQLGTFPLPIEIEPFAWALTIQKMRDVLSEQGYKEADVTLRAGRDTTYISDGGNLIADCSLNRIHDAPALDEEIHRIPGVVETGLFINQADQIIFADENGVQTITR